MPGPRGTQPDWLRFLETHARSPSRLRYFCASTLDPVVVFRQGSQPPHEAVGEKEETTLAYTFAILGETGGTGAAIAAEAASRG